MAKAQVSHTERIYSFLFVSLTALMLLLPFFGESWLGVTLAIILYAAMLAAIRELYVSWWPLAVTAVLFVFSAWGTTHETSTVEHEGAHAAAVIGFLVVQFAIVRDTLRRSDISLRTVLGASSAYMLTGLLFGNLFAIVAAVDPHAFKYPHEQMTSLDRHSLLTYLSYITMTTVGYGDVLPVSVPARFLCVAEAVFGQLFIAIFIARLVGLNAGRQRHAE